MRRRRPLRPARRRVWCRTWLAHRTVFGQYDNLLFELNREDSASYKNFLPVRNCLDRFFTKTVQIVQVPCHLRILASSLRMVTCCCELFTIVTSYLRVTYGQINPWTQDTREKIFDMSKKLPVLSRILTSVCELCRAIYGYQRVYLPMLASDYELAIRNDS